MKNLFDLTGQVAVVTGASGGLGVQMAKALANQGANIVLMARRKELLEKHAAAIAEEYGVQTLPIVCDITNTEQIKNAVQETVGKFGRVDILINNAGIAGLCPAEDVTDEQLEKEIAVDLLGVYKCAREFGKEMIKARYGRIINIASIFGLVAGMGDGTESTPYATAKGGVVNLTRSLAAEWGKYGITVNGICPAYFETEITKGSIPADVLEMMGQTQYPMRRIGQDGDLDTTVVFLASPNTSYVTGLSVPVDGGYTIL